MRNLSYSIGSHLNFFIGLVEFDDMIVDSVCFAPIDEEKKTTKKDSIKQTITWLFNDLNISFLLLLCVTYNNESFVDSHSAKVLSI